MKTEYPGWRERDRLVPAYRHLILDKMEIAPYRHQAQFFAKSDGRELGVEEYDPEEMMRDCGVERDRPPSRLVHPELGEFWLVNRPVMSPREYMRFGEMTTDDFPVYDEGGLPEMSLVYSPVTVEGSRPSVVYVTGSFKIGKSVVGGLPIAAALLVPGVRWRLVGTQYPITMREFEYVEEYLLSEKGLNIPEKLHHAKSGAAGRLRVTEHASRPKKGEIWLELSNGSRVESMSWYSGNAEPGAALKGDEVDGHTWSEFYQFPNIECLLEVRQNLRIRHGQDQIPTTPDRPVVEEVINRGQSKDSMYRTWNGVSDIKRKENPLAFDFDQMIEEMDSRTREKWLVHWEGKTGEYVGSVYDYVRGTRVFDTKTHPQLWKDPDAGAVPENLHVPAHWLRIMGADTGTYIGFAPISVDEAGHAYLLGEFVNYRYVGGVIERLDEVTIPRLVGAAREFLDRQSGQWRWVADWNTQYRAEIRAHGPVLEKGEKSPELRTDLTREYFQHDKIWFAPWLKVLPYEFEHAKYPDRQSSTGSNKRISVNDHVMDAAEHGMAILRRQASVRPTGPAPKGSYIHEFLASNPRRMPNEGFDHVLGD